MKKLNQTERYIVARRIAEKLNNPIHKRNKKLKEETKKEFLKSKEGQAYSLLNKKFPSVVSDYDLNSILSNIVKLERTVTTGAIEEEITLAQIDCESLEDLTNKVKAAFE